MLCYGARLMILIKFDLLKLTCNKL